MDLTINNHRLYVEQIGPGDGPAVVLLHHGLGFVRAWRGQVPAFVAAGYQVVAYDRWGYGGSDPRPSLDIPSFTADLDDIAALLSHLRIPCAVLIGHSDGGTIALYFAARHPQMVTCLVTIAAHVYAELEMEPGLHEIKRSFTSDAHFRSGMQYAHGEKYESVFSNWFDGWHRVESLSWDMRPQLSLIRCPTLVVQGEEDEYATAQHARDIAGSIPGAELWLLPGARHMLPQENAAEFNSKILQFLAAQHAGISNRTNNNLTGVNPCLAKS